MAAVRFGLVSRMSGGMSGAAPRFGKPNTLLSPSSSPESSAAANNAASTSGEPSADAAFSLQQSGFSNTTQRLKLVPRGRVVGTEVAPFLAPPTSGPQNTPSSSSSRSSTSSSLVACVGAGPGAVYHSTEAGGSSINANRKGKHTLSGQEGPRNKKEYLQRATDDEDAQEEPEEQTGSSDPIGLPAQQAQFLSDMLALDGTLEEYILKQKTMISSPNSISSSTSSVEPATGEAREKRSEAAKLVPTLASSTSGSCARQLTTSSRTAGLSGSSTSPQPLPAFNSTSSAPVAAVRFVLAQDAALPPPDMSGHSFQQFTLSPPPVPRIIHELYFTMFCICTKGHRILLVNTPDTYSVLKRLAICLYLHVLYCMQKRSRGVS